MQEIPNPPPALLKADSGPIARPDRLWWLAAQGVILALGNIACVPTLVRLPGPGRLSQILLGWEMGSILAQLLILAFFAVLGPGGNLPRQGIVWLAAAMLIASFAGGVELASKWITWVSVRDVLLFPLFAVPAILCAVQAPLWALRYFARWRTATSSGTAQDLGQISIRGMLAATAIVAVVLGLCRIGLAIENMYSDSRYGQPLQAANWWAGIGIASAIFLVFSTVVLPVTSLLVLRTRSGLLGVLSAAAYLACAALVYVSIVSSFSRRVPGFDECLAMLITYLAITGHLLVSLAIFRWAGYRLWWGQGPVA